MLFLNAHINVLLPLIAILSFFALAARHPNRSAIILLFEAIIIDIYLGIVHGITSTIFSASVLLTFFCLIVYGGNYYLELSFNRAAPKPPKLNIIIAAILAYLFWNYGKDFFSADGPEERLYFLNLNYDGLSLVVAGFALFAILVSSLLIFDLKNPKSGDQT